MSFLSFSSRWGENRVNEGRVLVVLELSTFLMRHVCSRRPGSCGHKASGEGAPGWSHAPPLPWEVLSNPKSKPKVSVSFYGNKHTLLALLTLS